MLPVVVTYWMHEAHMFQVNCFHHTLIFRKFCIFSKSILTLETIRWPSRKDQPRFQQRQQQQWFRQPIWDIPQEMQFQHQNLYLLEKPPSFRANLQVQQCEKKEENRNNILACANHLSLFTGGLSFVSGSLYTSFGVIFSCRLSLLVSASNFFSPCLLLSILLSYLLLTTSNTNHRLDCKILVFFSPPTNKQTKQIHTTAPWTVLVIILYLFNDFVRCDVGENWQHILNWSAEHWLQRDRSGGK